MTTPNWPNNQLDPNSICTTGLSSFVMSGVILNLIREQFRTPDNIVDPDLKGCIYSDDNTEERRVTTQITIEKAERYKAENIQQRPAIYVKRNDIKSTRVAIGDEMKASVQLRGYEEYTGIVKMEGSLTVLCMSAEPMQAERLGWEVWINLLEFAPLLTRLVPGVESCRAHSLGEITKVDESEEHFFVAATLIYSGWHKWQVNRKRPILQRIDHIINAT